MRYKVSLFFLGIAIAISSVTIPYHLDIRFKSNETWIPKHTIKQSLKSWETIRLYQWLHWPSFKKKLLTKYPMIQSITIREWSVKGATIFIVEKHPWILAIHDNQTYLFSTDGTQLNGLLTDFELPDVPILMVQSTNPTFLSPTLDPQTIQIMTTLSNWLKTTPLVTLKTIIFDANTLTLIMKNDLEIYLGSTENLPKKLQKLRYFLAAHHPSLNRYEKIDIQYPKRVIIKQSK